MPRRTDDPDAAAPARETGGVQSLSRGLTLLTLLAETDRGFTLTELAQRAGLAPSTAHRLLRGLEGRGFAEQSGDPSRWRVGVVAFTVGNAFARSRSVVTAARPTMQALMEEVGETVNLAILEDRDAVYLAQAESRQLMRAFARPGARVALHCSAVGKALLMGRRPSEIDKLLAGRPLTRITDKTIVTREALTANLKAAEARGWVADDEEHAIGLRCAAAPIFDETGTPLAALSVSGPAARIDDARLAEVGALVAKAADTVTRALGGRMPSATSNARPSDRASI